MADIQENKIQRNDEIDLLDLFRRMGNSLSRLFHKLGIAIVISIVFLLRKWIWLTLSVALGVGLSYLMKNASEGFYSSEMVISSNAITANEVISYANKLHTFCLEENKDELAKALGMEPEKIDLIKDIQAFQMKHKSKDGIPDYLDYTDRLKITDTLDAIMTDRLSITVKTNSPGELSDIRDGILRYIEQNQLFVRQNDIRMAQNNEIIIRIDHDIKQLDSLQKIKYFEETKNKTAEKGGQIVFLQEQKTQLIYDEIYQLYMRKRYFEKQKEVFPGVVTLLSDFTVPIKPKNSAFYYGKVIIPLLFGVCLLILVLVHNRKKLISAYNKYE